jgi:hypothetical protein
MLHLDSVKLRALAALDGTCPAPVPAGLDVLRMLDLDSVKLGALTALHEEFSWLSRSMGALTGIAKCFGVLAKQVGGVRGSSSATALQRRWQQPGRVWGGWVALLLGWHACAPRVHTSLAAGTAAYGATAARMPSHQRRARPPACLPAG